MAEATVTSRVKAAVRRWAGMNPDDGLTLDEKLDILRPDASAELRVEINREFEGNRGFLIETAEWNQMALETVRDVRDKVKTRSEE
jgi:hypothetical protein